MANPFITSMQNTVPAGAGKFTAGAGALANAFRLSEQRQMLKDFQQRIQDQTAQGVDPSRALLNVLQQDPSLIVKLPSDVFNNAATLAKLMQPTDLAPGHELLDPGDPTKVLHKNEGEQPADVKLARFIFPDDPEKQRLFLQQNETKAPQTRTVRVGQKDVAQHFDPLTGKWIDDAVGDAFAPTELIRNVQKAFPNDPKAQQTALQEHFRVRNQIADLIHLRDQAAAEGKTEDAKTYSRAIDAAVKAQGILGLLSALGGVGNAGAQAGGAGLPGQISQILGPAPANAAEPPIAGAPAAPPQAAPVQLDPKGDEAAQLRTLAQTVQSLGQPMQFIDVDGKQKTMDAATAQRILQKVGGAAQGAK